MAFWNSNEIYNINEGASPNDGTGDSIRDAFLKVDSNFSNLSAFLAQPTVEFLNANVGQQLNTVYLTSTNSFTANTTGNTASFLANATVGNLIANSGIYSTGITSLTGNTRASNVTVTGQLEVQANVKLSASIIPSANLQYDLGSPNNFFRNIYSQGVVNVNTVTASSDAGLLQLHASLSPGDTKDVGVFGKFYKNGANSFAFFGQQYSSGNFVYKITNTDVTLGNSVVYDGVFGNAQIGSLLLSNTTASTSTSTGALIVAGGVGVAGNITAPYFNGNVVGTVANVARLSVTGTVAGNVTVDGNIFAYGGQVLTTGSLPVGVSGGAIFTAGTQSTSTGSGAVVLTAGGLGVNGNVFAGGFSGPYYGTIQTAAQPNITSVGTLTSLNVGSVSATSVGVTTITATSISSGALTGLNALTIGGALVASTVSAATIGNSGATLTGTISTGAQPNITSLTTVAATNFSSGNAVIAGGYINSLTNVSATTATLTTVNAQTTTSTQLNATNGNITTEVATNFSSGNAVITGGSVNGTPIGATTRSTGAFSYLVAATGLSTANAVITGGSVDSAPIGATTRSTGAFSYLVAATGLSTANAVITGGSVNGTPIGASSTSTGAFTTLSASSTVSGTGFSTYLASPPAIGGTAAAAGSFTSLSASSTVSGTGFSTYLASPPAIGGTAAAAGSFTTLSASSTVSGTGFSTYLASPPAIGGTVAAPGAFTSLSASSTVSGAGFSTYLASPPAIGGTAAAAGKFTTLQATSTTTLAGLTTSAAILPNANNTLNIGAVGTTFATVYATTFSGVSTTAQYADLAENYASDAEYEPGTVVIFGGDEEITTTNIFADVRVAGAISTNPAYLMNSEFAGQAVALRGRIPVKVIGAVQKGDLLVTAGQNPGYATSIGQSTEYPLAVFAKAIETNTDEGKKIITAVII